MKVDINLPELREKLFLCFYNTDDPVIHGWLGEALKIIDPSFEPKEFPNK